MFPSLVNIYLIICYIYKNSFYRLLDCTPVTYDFHSRHSCKSRTYMYRFMIPKVSEEQRISLVEMLHTFHLRFVM